MSVFVAMNSLEQAISEVKEMKASIREAARNNNVNYSTLYRHVNTTVQDPGRKPFLTAFENEKLQKYIDFCLKRGCPRSPRDVRDSAYIILKLRLAEKARRPGNTWLQKFLRDNRLTIRKSENLPKSSAVVSKDDIVDWFTRTGEALESEGVLHILEHPSRILNADETFMLFNPKQSRVVTPIAAKNVYDIQGEFFPYFLLNI